MAACLGFACNAAEGIIAIVEQSMQDAGRLNGSPRGAGESFSRLSV